MIILWGEMLWNIYNLTNILPQEFNLIILIVGFFLKCYEIFTIWVRFHPTVFIMRSFCWDEIYKITIISRKEASPINRKIFITVIYSYLVRGGGVWISSQIYSYINFAILIISKKKKRKRKMKEKNKLNIINVKMNI